MRNYIIPLHLTVENESDLDEVFEELENGLQDGVDSGPLSKETSWHFAGAMPAGPYKTLADKAATAHIVKLANGTAWEVGRDPQSGAPVLISHGSEDTCIHYVDEDVLAGATFYRLTEF